jgi:hypothetical protein
MNEKNFKKVFNRIKKVARKLLMVVTDTFMTICVFYLYREIRQSAYLKAKVTFGG